MEQKSLLKLIIKLKEYIKFLSKEYSEAYKIANIHHYKCSKESIELGEKLRNEIKELESKVL